MASYPAPWSLCGGWAVDAWLGRVSREHGDIDLSVFVEDQHALYEHLRDWQLLAHDAAWEPGGGDEWWDGTRHLGFPSHIHARPPERAGAMPKDGIATDEDGFFLDIQIDARAGDEWVVLHDPRISIAVRARRTDVALGHADGVAGGAAVLQGARPAAARQDGLRGAAAAAHGRAARVVA